MKKRPFMAIRTETSRTAPARVANWSCSSASRPNRVTSSAPLTLNRSVMLVDISPLSCICCRVSSASLRPTILAGMRKIGSITSAARVSCQLRMSIAASTSTRLIRLDSTVDSVEVNACWAPITSELSRETSLPVWVRVKNASGIRTTWSNTWVRRSKISPSPILEEHQRCTSPITACSTARPATVAPSMISSGRFCLSTPSSMISLNSSGGVTARADEMTTSTTKTVIMAR